MSKIISFIIPAYNSEEFLDKCIPSFINEEVFEELDIIIVNDGSKDKTPEIAQKYCDMYPASVRLINQENKGHGGALNTGCEAAIGKYLKVIDADDWVETENLSEFVNALKNCESDVVLTHYYTIDISTNEVKKWKSYPKEFNKTYSFDQIMSDWRSFDRVLLFHGITYNTNFYQTNKIKLSEHVFYEDHEFSTIPCCYAKTITPLDLFIYDYRIGDIQQSVSDLNQLKRLPHTETVLNRLIEEYKNLKMEEHCAGRTYYCMKAQALLLSYIRTVMLLEKDRKHGRELGTKMMARFERCMPDTYAMAEKQYKIFRMLNICHISKKKWDELSNSKIYNLLRKKRDFN